LNLSIGITTGASFTKVKRLASIAQKNKVYGIWIGDDLDRLHDIFTLTSIFLLKTKQTKVGIGVTNPLFRNITTIARATAGLIEVDSEGRFVLGLGIGGLQDLANKGLVAQKPFQILRDASYLLRRIWSGEKVSFSGSFAINGYSAKCKYNIPIYFGVRGPKLLELAGEVADGVIISGPRSYIDKAISLVKKGLKKSDDPIRSFKMVVWLPTIFIGDSKEASIVREAVSLAVSDTPKKVLELSTVDKKRALKIQNVVQRYGVKTASEYVTEDLMRDFSIFGNAQEICEDFHSLEKIGVDEVVFGPPYGLDWQSSIEKILEEWKQL